jgi:DNA-binding transcriptional MerR regulator
LHNTAEIMRRTGMPRETLFRFREAGLIAPVEYSPLGRPLYPSAVYGQIERIEELRVLGMNLQEVRDVFAREEESAVAANIAVGEQNTGAGE